MKGKNKLYLIITVLVLIMAALFAVLVISNNTNKKIQNGLIKDNLIHYSDVSREEIDEFDDMSKAIFNKVSCTFENVVYNYDDTGKADVTVCYPDMERILPETYNNVIYTPSVLDKYSGETEWDRYEVEKTFRGKKLHMVFENPRAKESGFTSLTVNGETMKDHYIPFDILKDENEVVYTF